MARNWLWRRRAARRPRACASGYWLYRLQGLFERHRQGFGPHRSRSVAQCAPLQWRRPGGDRSAANRGLGRRLSALSRPLAKAAPPQTPVPVRRNADSARAGHASGRGASLRNRYRRQRGLELGAGLALARFCLGGGDPPGLAKALGRMDSHEIRSESAPRRAKAYLSHIPAQITLVRSNRAGLRSEMFTSRGYSRGASESSSVYLSYAYANR